ncbi:MAG: hypothetical protein ACU0CY_08085 [Maritimibacter harenae]
MLKKDGKDLANCLKRVHWAYVIYFGVVMDQSDAQQKLEEISEIESSQASRIPFQLFDRHDKKTTRLADLDEPTSPAKGKNDWYKFEFTEPVFVRRLRVDAEDYEFKKCEFKWSSLSKGETETSKASFSEGSFSLEINDFITSFAFRPEKKWYGNQVITAVTAEGFTLDEFDSAREKVYRVNSIKAEALKSANATIERAQQAQAEIETLQQKANAIIAEIDTRESEIKHADQELEKRTAEMRRVDEALSEKKAEQSAIAARVERQESTIEQRNHEREMLGQEINEKRAELKELESNIYLFPSELKEFAERGGEHKAFYWKLSIIPLVVLSIMAGLLLFDAHNLAPIIDENDRAKVFSIFMTRIPYVVVATAIIGSMFKIAQLLISQVIRIDDQTRALAKVSIIATDVNGASEEGLNLSDEEKYHLRTGLKMDLLRDHLKHYISDSFSYSNSDRIASRVAFLKERRRKKDQLDSEQGDESSGAGDPSEES